MIPFQTGLYENYQLLTEILLGIPNWPYKKNLVTHLESPYTETMHKDHMERERERGPFDYMEREQERWRPKHWSILNQPPDDSSPRSHLNATVQRPQASKRLA